MTARTAIPLIARLAAAWPAGLAAGQTLDVATAMPGVAVPAWIKIAHRGELRCRDGRTFTLDPEVVIARFSAEATDVPIDIGHATVSNHAAPAFGWIKELQARPDGLYGRPEWLSEGKALLAARTHRYVSPAFHHDDQGRVTWLHSVALVAAPALANMPALAAAQPHQEPSMKSIATALGLQPDAGEPAVLAAVTTLQTSTVSKAVHDETLAKLSAATGELTAIRDAGHKADVERELEAALTAKKILPAQKERFVKLSATAEGFGEVKALLAATAANSVAGASTIEGKKPETGAAAEKDAATLSVEATKYAAEHSVSFVDAMSIVTRKAA